MLKYAKKLDISDWVDEIMEVKRQYPINMNSYKGVTPEKIIKTINEMYDDLIITTDVGQNQLWTTQYIALGGENQLLTSGGLGTMGYGLPAAIGAKIGNPDKNVICRSLCICLCLLKCSLDLFFLCNTDSKCLIAFRQFYKIRCILIRLQMYSRWFRAVSH